MPDRDSDTSRTHGARLLESVLSYQVILPDDVDVHDALSRLRMLEEEDPQLHVAWNEQTAGDTDAD